MNCFSALRKSNVTRNYCIAGVLSACSVPLFGADLSQLLSVELEQESAGIVTLTLEMDRDSSWSTVRNSEGELVIELWETVTASFVEVPTEAVHGVRVISIETKPDGPVTRLTVADGGAEYELTPSGLTLHARFHGVNTGAEATFVAPEPVEEVEPTVELSDADVEPMSDRENDPRDLESESSEVDGGMDPPPGNLDTVEARADIQPDSQPVVIQFPVEESVSEPVLERNDGQPTPVLDTPELRTPELRTAELPTFEMASPEPATDVPSAEVPVTVEESDLPVLDHAGIDEAGTGQSSRPVAFETPDTSSAVRPIGTPGNPYLAAVTGSSAAKLLLTVEPLDVVGSYRLLADGDIGYRAFALSEPHRFVIDLLGLELVADNRELSGPSAGPVERVRLGQFADSPDPVARIVFDLSQAGIPWVESGENQLVVRFDQETGAAIAQNMGSSPAPIVETVEVAEEIGSAPSSVVETIPEALPGRFQSMPAGPLATQLLSASWTTEQGVSELRLVGDGGFHYGTFTLAAPDRLVIDLLGVAKSTETQGFPGSGNVAGVRIGLFESEPKPITRVVFDLNRTVAPSFERGDGLLIVRFPEDP